MRVITPLMLVILILHSYNTIGLENSTFSQEIRLPIDTSLYEAKFHPVDMEIEFKHPCWALDEKNHSVRIYCDGNFGTRELESQIYDLKFLDEKHISSCRVVFLVPEYANGRERYIVRYSDSEVAPPEYKDHVYVEDDHYYYEPIRGQRIDFDYFKIVEDGKYIVYGIMQAGVLLDTKTCHTIVKLKPNSTEFETVNADQFASFAFRYRCDGKDTGTDCSKDVEKSILIDGNLMVRVRIRSLSPDGKVETDNVYSYYYSPMEKKRMIVRVNHRILETIDKVDEEKDGIYASISTFKSRSSSIRNMNVGEILPHLYFYDDRGMIQTIDVPRNPTTEEVYWVVSTRDDKDIGDKAWVAMGNPEGKLHAIIFSSNSNISSENDGLQIKLGVKEHVKMPGLEADSCNLYINRNSYDKGTKQDLRIEKGTNISFEAEFITFEKWQLDLLNMESNIYQSLSRLRAIKMGEFESEERIKNYNLTIDVHLAPSIPFGTLLSATTGKNLSYIYIEIYREGNLISSGTASRLPLSGEIPSFDNKSLVEKMKIALSLFDWGNTSLFKRLIVPQLKEGRYLVEVYRENPIFGERRFIGFGIVNLDEDKKLDIFCSPQVEFIVSLKDGSGEYIKEAELLLRFNDEIIKLKKTSDREETIVFPYKRGKFTLDIIYQGFLIDRINIRPKIIDVIRGIRLEKRIELYNLIIRIKDVMGLDFGTRLYPTLTSDEMIDKINIGAAAKDDEYIFENLYPATYNLKIDYRGFSIEKDVELYSNKELEIKFPATHRLRLRLKDNLGFDLDEAKITLIRDRKEMILNVDKGTVHADIPPGNYFVKIESEDKTIARLYLDVYGDKDIILLTSEISALNHAIFYIGVLFSLASVIALIFKKNLNLFLTLLSVSLIVLSIHFPWWLLEGESVDISTRLTLYPPAMSSFISTDLTYGGEINTIPEIINLILSLIFYTLIANILIILASNFLRTRKNVLIVLSVILSTLSMTLFFYSVSGLTEVGIGGFQGKGRIEISILGEQLHDVDCSWGPSLGFLMIGLSIILLSVMSIREMIEGRFEMKRKQ